jgi:hypothetical protein
MAIIRQMGGYDEELDTNGKEVVVAPALLPKSVLQGKRVEPGDKLILRISEVLEDEIAVTYDSSTTTDEPEPPEPPAPPEMPPEPDTTAPALSGYD